MPRKGQKIPLNLERLKSLVRIQCTAEECAGVLDMSADTLDRRLKDAGFAGFAEFYKRYSHEGKASLRRAQWKAAIKYRNTTMLIWLGKQHLGQKDQQEVAHGGEVVFKGLNDFYAGADQYADKTDSADT